MSIDPRLMERRQTVAEDNAKRNVSRLLKFLAVVVVVGCAVWLAFSPWLSVSQVDVEGVSASSANVILAERGVVAGTPMIRVDAGSTEKALLEDPWIDEATVRLDWPDVVTVDVVERVPVAWTKTADGWTRRAVDGVALPSGPEPDEAMARIDMPELAEIAVTTAPEMIGALDFIDALPAAQHKGTVVSHQDGELWATVSGHQVRLGRAVEMREKAVSLVALLQETLPDDAVLILIAPTNPAVSVPGDETGQQVGATTVEAEDQNATGDDDGAVEDEEGAVDAGIDD